MEKDPYFRDLFTDEKKRKKAINLLERWLQDLNTGNSNSERNLKNK